MNKINFKKYLDLIVKKFSIDSKKFSINSKKFSIDFKKYSTDLKKFSGNFKKYIINKIVLSYIAGFIIIVPTIYLSIPIFFDYEKSKKRIEDKIYSDFNLKSSVEGEIRYNLFPSPRIKIKNLIIKDFIDNKKNLGEVEFAVLKIPIKKLASLDKINFNSLELKNSKINIDLNKLKKYKKYFAEQFKSKNIRIYESDIKLFDGTNHLATINNTIVKYDAGQDVDETTLKGQLFEKSVTIQFKNRKNPDSPDILFIKYPSLNFKAHVVLSASDDLSNTDGQISLYLDHLKGNFHFVLNDSLVKIKKGDIRNRFFNGKIVGKINFSPFFNFDLDLDISSFNFRLISKILKEMSNEEINNLLILNSKINGNLSLFIKKIYTTSKLVKSLESRIQFRNKNILIDQMLLDLGKLGAADITGMIKNKDDKINFHFKKNLFIDNPKYFYSKFGVYNKKREPEDMYVSGKFNFYKAQISLDELIADSKLNKDDIRFFEQEFNQTLLENGFKTLLDFAQLKEFVKLVSPPKNWP